MERITAAVTKWTGSTAGIFCAVLSQIIWGIFGYLQHWSESVQMIENTGTSIVTFLMVFLFQKSQNKDSKAFHLKLDELIYSLKDARNDRAAAEELTEQEIDELKKQKI